MLDIKMNFGGNRSIKNKCPICKVEEDSQKHVFECKITIKKFPEVDFLYEDIFSENIKKISNVIEVLEKVLNFCEQFCEEN